MTAADTVPVYASPMPAIRKIELDRPWQWLVKGWQDMRRVTAVGYTYGVLAALTGYVLTFGLLWLDMLYSLLPLMAGFLIVGPVLTVGLYEVSRRAEHGQTTTPGRGDGGLPPQQQPDSPGRDGADAADVHLGPPGGDDLLSLFRPEPPSFENLIVSTFLQADTLPFLIVGTVVGGALALLAFSISVVSIPLLLDRPQANVVDAIATSFRTVQTNFVPDAVLGRLDRRCSPRRGWRPCIWG